MNLVLLEGNTLNTGRLRQLWATIEETHTYWIHGLNDNDLVQQLLTQLNNQHPLSYEEFQVISSYLKMRLPLIRDMA
jgi:muconolactone delta-isomerase